VLCSTDVDCTFYLDCEVNLVDRKQGIHDALFYILKFFWSSVISE
jgi:hypothetical protein